jgi:hypothetical protein
METKEEHTGSLRKTVKRRLTVSKPDNKGKEF